MYSNAKWKTFSHNSLRKKRWIAITWIFTWTSVILNSTSRNVKFNVFATANVHPLEAKWYACLYWHFCFQLTSLFNWLIYKTLWLISLLRQLVHPVLLNLAKWSFTICLYVLSFPRLRINVRCPLDVLRSNEVFPKINLSVCWSESKRIWHMSLSVIDTRQSLW